MIGENMIEKNFKNLNEQLEILKHKGMIIRDDNYVKKVYKKNGKALSFFNNYFFLIAQWKRWKRR